MTTLSVLKDSLIREGIVKIKNIDEEPFTLKSGKKSRLFIDIKEASLNPIILNQIVDTIIVTGDAPAFFEICFRSGISRKQYNDEGIRIGSVAVGGIPIGTALSLKTGIKHIIVRSEKHDTGTKSQILGDCKGKHVILIEDVVTTGGSIISAVNAIRDAGGECNTCIVVVDREEGAFQNCKNNEIFLVSLLKKSDFGIIDKI